jgi:hypothetical protein
VCVLGLFWRRRLWRRIADCVPELQRVGTLKPAEKPDRTALTALLRLDKITGYPGDRGAFDRVQRRFGDVPRQVKVALLVIVFGGGLVLAILLRNAIDQYVFQVWVPGKLSPAAQQQWLAEVRRNWWASSEHLPGYLLYGLLAWLGMSLIVAYFLMGIIAVIYAVATYQVIEPSAEWFNKDGAYGWQPAADVYRSVYATVALYCAIISILIILLGANTPIAVIALAALLVLPVPVFVYIPWHFFCRLEAAAKKRRVYELSCMLEDLPEADLAGRQAFVAEFARCREVRIRPMLLTRLQVSGVTSVILLPIALTLVQVYLPLLKIGG